MREHEPQPDQVIADCSEVIDQDPSNVDARFKRSRAWYPKAEYAKVIVDIDVVLQENTHHAPALFIRSLAFSKLNKYELAISDFTESILGGLEEKCLPNCLLAAAHAERGDFDSAIEVLRSVLILDTDDDEQDALFCLQ